MWWPRVGFHPNNAFNENRNSLRPTSINDKLRSNSFLSNSFLSQSSFVKVLVICDDASTHFYDTSKLVFFFIYSKKFFMSVSKVFNHTICRSMNLSIHVYLSINRWIYIFTSVGFLDYVASARQ